LPAFLRTLVWESGVLEASYCTAACRIALAGFPEGWLNEWLHLNEGLSARKPARESRDASAAMGRRFLELALELEPLENLITARNAARESAVPVHSSAAFGLVAGALTLPPAEAGAAYLLQSFTGLVSACQRLLPLGQSGAHQILWDLQHAILQAADKACATPPDEVPAFTHGMDLASMRHSQLPTRLFIS
jgi:urease accessory protein